MAKYSALIPAAGSGVRLRPFTFTRPKPLVYVAGKPILGHIIENLVDIVDEITVIVGYMAQDVEDYCLAEYGSAFKFNFVMQEERKGLGHAILQGKASVPEGGLMITLGDEIFGMPYSDMVVAHEQNAPCDASLGLKVVEDPRNYGVVEIADDGQVSSMVEKPEHPTSDLALAGVYIFDRASDIFTALEELVQRDIRTRGEFQLTDAMSLMMGSGSVFKSFIIEKWYDCGRPDMLVRVNHRLLDDSPTTNLVNISTGIDDTIIVLPVAIEEGCQLKGSVVGPYVSVGKGTVIRSSILSDCIVGEDCDVRDMILQGSVLADRVELKGTPHRMTVGEETQIDIE